MLCRSPRRKKKSFSPPGRSPSLDCRNSLATALRPLSWTQTIIGKVVYFSATMVTSLPSFSLSLSHRMYLTHNIGSASALPIIRHVQQTQDDSTFGKAAGDASEETWKKRSTFSHLCNVFLMYSKWQPNYTHCKFGAYFHRWTEFAFTWRTGKQRPRVVHAVTITCLHSKYSFELQRRQAEDPRVVHAMTLAPADFSWRTDREGAHGLGPIWQQPSCTQVRFGVGEKTIEGGHGAYMQRPARTFTVDVCFHWRTVKQSSRVKHAVPQQPVDSNLIALQVFFELQRRQAWEPRVVHPRGVHAMTATWVVEKRAEEPRVVDAMTLTFTIEVFLQLKNWQRGLMAWIV